MHRRTLCWGALLLVCLLADLPAAHAADQDRAAYAEQLFQHGVRLMKDDNCPEAIPEFLTSQQLDPSAATLMNLATCYARVGRKAAAWKTYRQAAAAAAEEQNEQLRAKAFQAMSILSPLLTKLKLVPASQTAALSFRVNGEPIATNDGMPIPLDPGENVIEAVAPGHKPWRRSVTASDVGATLVIEVPELRPVQKTEKPNDWRTAGAIAGGIGIAAMVVGTVLAVSAKRAQDDSDAHCRAGRCNATGVDLRESAQRRANLATYATGVGALVTAAGVYLWFATPPATEKRAGGALWLDGVGGAVGMGVRGRL
jgi:hypothetical protein